MNKLDQHIKDKLSQPQLPPTDAWKNIQQKLDEKEKKKRIVPIFYWISSTAACLVAGISVYYYFNQNDATTNHPFPTNEIVKTNTNSNQNFSNKNENVEEKNSFKNPVTSTINNLPQDDNMTKQPNSYFDELNKKSTLFSTTNQKEENQTQKFPLNNSFQNELSDQKNNSFSEKGNNFQQNTILKNQDEKPLELVLEEEKKKKEEEKIEIKPKAPILAISSYVNPTIILDSKSILANEFNDYNIKNSITVAYGAKVSVRINKNLNIRSGIAKVELQQHTTNVNSGINTGISALSANAPKSSNNINYHTNIRVVANNASQSTMMTMLSSETNNMEQKINYIEVPVEAEYKLASFEKFNLLATAGGSYYILTKNSISLADTNTKSRYKLGEANNLNNTSYSANAGVKLEYNLSNKSSINLEPNYRYMINPLKNVDTKNPSLFGLNLGLSIKF
ncbi:porin family protein [Empedobacter falsenii]